MQPAQLDNYPTLSLCHIEKLSNHTANFMASRSRERTFLPQPGAQWWQIRFDSPIILEQFISTIYLHGFFDDIDIQGLQVEIQTNTNITAQLIQSLTGDDDKLSIENLQSEVITINNDSHAMICNSKNSGAMVFSGELTTHFQFDAFPSPWVVLEELSKSVSIHDIIHFDPIGHVIVRGGEEVRDALEKQLGHFVK
ncbi:hypothetical protein QWZ04_05460 [Vibrio tapetis subsp. quintayensis]|uniref:hypothetical protein n=1 Tax=Vibrio tapetis TaxID=52443 RepID=UPI0025B404D4|nr:hypothetical protein [Vibrio tapetis]MDN3679774.1 hypothetical protein [Vibrio tapetis subsp. quintayensis]